MPRYLVERRFPDGLAIPIDDSGATACQLVIAANAAEGVTWIHSYVTLDQQTTFCIYDGPNPQAIRQAAQANQLPVDRITKVRVLDPYFHH
jgi:Nickel responsive protein SCO4226-like